MMPVASTGSPMYCKSQYGRASGHEPCTNAPTIARRSAASEELTSARAHIQAGKVDAGVDVIGHGRSLERARRAHGVGDRRVGKVNDAAEDGGHDGQSSELRSSGTRRGRCRAPAIGRMFVGSRRVASGRVDVDTSSAVRALRSAQNGDARLSASVEADRHR